MQRPRHFELDIDAMIASVDERFRLVFENRAHLRTLIEQGLRFQSAQNADHKLKLFDSNYFSEELFQGMISGGDTYLSNPIKFLWQRLEASGIVHSTFGYQPGAFVTHQLDLSLLWEHIYEQTFPNIFAPPASLATRYADSIVSINVDKDGDEHCGSGFIVKVGSDHQPWLVTCRHNVDPDDKIAIDRITTAGSKSVATAPFVLSSDHDLAVARVTNAPAEFAFPLSEAVAMFDEVYTLGFPNIPLAAPVLTGHRGEVNAITDLYIDKSPVVIISNLVSPGSSGGPVLRADGRCVGMTIRWLEGKTSDDVSTRFSAALPSEVIRSFLVSQ